MATGASTTGRSTSESSRTATTVCVSPRRPVDVWRTQGGSPQVHRPKNSNKNRKNNSNDKSSRPEQNEKCVTYVAGQKCYLCFRLLRECGSITYAIALPERGGGSRPRVVSSLHADLVEPPAQLLRRVDGVLVRAGDAVHPIEGPGHPAELAHGAQNFAVGIDLDDLADAADIHHLARAGRDADRPGGAADAPFLLEVAVGIEGLDAAIGAVGHVEGVLLVDDDAVRRVELAGRGSALAPLLDQVAFLAELGDARISVAVGDEDAAVGSPCDIGWLVEILRLRYGVLDHVRHVGPGFRPPAQHHLNVHLLIELHDQIGAGVDVPKVVLRIDPYIVRPFGRNALADRAHEGAV